MSKLKQKAFLEIYEPIKLNLWRYCMFLCRNKHDAEDLLGDTIINAYKGFENVVNSKAFLSYLFTIAHRNYYKRFDKNIKTEELNLEVFDFDSGELLPDMITDIKILLETLNLLPIEQKEAIILKEIEGFAIKEIAIIQNVSDETVKSRIYRGKLKLKEILEVNYGGQL